MSSNKKTWQLFGLKKISGLEKLQSIHWSNILVKYIGQIYWSNILLWKYKNFFKVWNISMHMYCIFKNKLNKLLETITKAILLDVIP